MVLESELQPAKKGRGRPRKYPVEQTGTTRKDLQEAVARGSAMTHHVAAPSVTAHTSASVKATTHHTAAAVVGSRQKKAPSHNAPETMTREEELAAFENNSNKSGVLTLFVLLLGVGLIGYGMYNRLKQASPEMVQPTPLESRANLGNAIAAQDADTASENTKAWDTKPTTTKPVVATAWADVLVQYVAALAKKDIAALAPLQDTSFKALPTLRTYFNTTRLTTFAKATSTLAIKDLTENTTDAALKRNPTAKAYDFNLVYTLADGKEYSDAWRAYTIVKDSGTVINGFVYQGNSTAKSPFFSFSKFGIK